jgi:hypothetical protein
MLTEPRAAASQALDAELVLCHSFDPGPSAWPCAGWRAAVPRKNNKSVWGPPSSSHLPCSTHN